MPSASLPSLPSMLLLMFLFRLAAVAISSMRLSSSGAETAQLRGSGHAIQKVTLVQPDMWHSGKCSFSEGSCV